MSILILATSGSRGELALTRPGGGLAVEPLAEGAARGRGVMPTIRRLLGDEGPAGLTGIVVDVGPGSFTGVRVGVTTAKALAFSLDVPVVGVLSLRAMAEMVDADEEVVTVRDAGRGGLYYAHYLPSEGGDRPLRAGPGRAFAEDVQRLAGDVRIVDEACGADAFLAIGERLLASGRAVPPHVLAPVYLQASAPERKRAGEKDDPAAAAASRNRP